MVNSAPEQDHPERNPVCAFLKRQSIAAYSRPSNTYV
jgi:hypothetical protein